MADESKSEISILKESIDHVLSDEKVIAEFERKFLEKAPSLFENWERSNLEQLAALQFIRANYRKATLMLLLKHAKQYNEWSHETLDSLSSRIYDQHNTAVNLEKYAVNLESMAKFLGDELKANKAAKKANAKKAANALHDQQNGTREKKAKIIALWKSGKYKSRHDCANKEYEALSISYVTARKALINVPK